MAFEPTEGQYPRRTADESWEGKTAAEIVAEGGGGGGGGDTSRIAILTVAASTGSQDLQNTDLALPIAAGEVLAVIFDIVTEVTGGTNGMQPSVTSPGVLALGAIGGSTAAAARAGGITSSGAIPATFNLLSGTPNALHIGGTIDNTAGGDGTVRLQHKATASGQTSIIRAGSTLNLTPVTASV